MNKVRQIIGWVCFAAGSAIVLGADAHFQLSDLLLQILMGLGLIAIGAIWIRD